MEIIKNKNADALTLAIEGRLDTNTAPALESAIKDELAETSTLTLDFEKLEYVSSAGLRVLLMAQKEMSAKGGTMVVKNVRDEIMEVFEITGFSDILTIE